jgi:hypothetical protein
MNTAKQKRDLGHDLNLVELLVQPGQGPCVSIVVGLHGELNQRKQNITLLNQALGKAQTALQNFSCSPEVRQLVSDRLESLVTRVNFDEPEGGIGLFVSPQVSTLVSFPFPVNEIVLVGNSFEAREILYLRQYLTPYYIASVTKTSVHLYKAHADSVQEIRDGGLPFIFEDDYEYARSTPGSSVGYGMKGFEKDKSVMTEMRVKSFVRAAAHRLNGRFAAGEPEIVVCGPTRSVNEFADACSAKDNLIKVAGSHNAGEFSDLVQAAWKACQSARTQLIEKFISELEELGPNYKAIGIRKVWSEATRGNGLLLLVERDYMRPAYIPDGTGEIRLHPPKGKYETIADAVDDVIEKVLQAGGKAIIAESNQLRRFEQIGLMLRHK